MRVEHGYLTIESVDYLCYGGGIVSADGCADGQTHYGVGNSLGDRHLQVRILLVAGLQVGWSGIVDVGVDAADAQVFAKLVALLDADGILVPHLLHIAEDGWFCYEFVANLAVVGLSHFATTLGFLVDVAQFYAQGSCLNLVDATIISCEYVVVATVAAVVGEGFHCSGNGVVLGGYSAGIAKCAEVFCRVEAKSGSVTESAGSA